MCPDFTGEKETEARGGDPRCEDIQLGDIKALPGSGPLPGLRLKLRGQGMRHRAELRRPRGRPASLEPRLPLKAVNPQLDPGY